MNKYIKTDIDTANTSLKAATNNVLHAIENGEIDSFDFVSHYPLSLMYEVLSQRGFFNVIKEHFTIDAIISSYDNGKILLDVTYVIKSGELLIRKVR